MRPTQKCTHKTALQQPAYGHASLLIWLSCWIAWIGFVATTVIWGGRPALANCPFCTAVSQTLRQEIKASEAAAIVSYVQAESDATAKFEIQRVLRGDKLFSPKQQIDINFFGKAKAEQRFLVMGVDPPDLLWSAPLVVSDKAISYVEKVVLLPDDKPIERLKFYLQYLDDTDPVLSRDVFDEFASASYAEMIQLKDQYDHDKLLKNIRQNDLSPDRRRMYLVMLGICGNATDAKILEEMLLSPDQSQQAGLDALISCYMSLKGADALKLVNERFLLDRTRSYVETYSAIMALRFHGTEGGAIDRKHIIDSFRLILERPELADMIIPDLARWEDWSQIDRIVELFKTADEKSSWLKVPAVNYLRACPKPEAAAALEELKKLDPDTVRKASLLPMLPTGAGSSNNSSSQRIKPNLPFAWRSEESSRTSQIFQPNSWGPKPQKVAECLIGSSSTEQSSSPSSMNPGRPLSVIGMSVATLWLGMWILLTGAGRQPAWWLRLVELSRK